MKINENKTVEMTISRDTHYRTKIQFNGKQLKEVENKRYSYDAGYKLKVIAYAEEHGNRAAEWHFGPPPMEKTIHDWRASKE